MNRVAQWHTKNRATQNDGPQGYAYHGNGRQSTRQALPPVIVQMSERPCPPPVVSNLHGKIVCIRKRPQWLGCKLIGNQNRYTVRIPWYLANLVSIGQGDVITVISGQLISYDGSQMCVVAWQIAKIV